MQCMPSRRKSAQVHYTPSRPLLIAHSPIEDGVPPLPVQRPTRIERDGNHLKRKLSLAEVLGQIESIDLSHDSSTLVVGGSKGELIVVKVDTGEIRVTNLSGFLQNSTRGVVHAKTSGVGARCGLLYRGGAGYESNQTGQEGSHPEAARSDLHRPVCGRDKKIGVHSTAGGEEMFVFDMTIYLFNHPTVVEFSNGGHWLAAGGDMRKARYTLNITITIAIAINDNNANTNTNINIDV
ncbi:hypothetical protein T492DRAFT_840025 [Pavlovales sp. CCMP2436]|nr:hypothetical protein T492DRAFT_840025 [Pavlovales sp. CCMP2436]